MSVKTVTSAIIPSSQPICVTEPNVNVTSVHVLKMPSGAYTGIIEKIQQIKRTINFQTSDFLNFQTLVSRKNTSAITASSNKIIAKNKKPRNTPFFINASIAGER